MAVKIKGIIGLDIVGTEFSNTISRFDGDITLEIDSPGGSLSDGITIANALEDYTRGKINVRVVGQASSMAAYIMLFGDTLTFKPNARVVLHNPWNLCIGDYLAMEKNADVLKRFSALYAKKFVEKGIFTEKEIRSIMDAETYFIGEETKRLGKLEKAGEEPPQDRETAILITQEHIKNCQARLREKCTDDIDKVAALLPVKTCIQAIEKPQTPTIPNQKEKEIKIMNLEELKAQHPEIYAQALQEGIDKNQKRINALMNFIDVDKTTTVDAITNGKSIHDEEVYAKFLQANINANTIRAMEENNPPSVVPKEETHAPENELGEGDDETAKAQKQEKIVLDKILAHFKTDDK